MAVRDLTARNAIEGRLWVRIYIFIFIYFLCIFFSIEFFEGVSRGGPYRWSMDRFVRWSVDPVRWTGPRTGGQCFRVTRSYVTFLELFQIFVPLCVLALWQLVSFLGLD